MPAIATPRLLARGTALALGFALSLLTPDVLQAQTITFSFDNARATASNTFTVDVMATTDAAGVTAGARLGDTQVYINYNTAGFGSSIAGSVTVNEGTLMQDVSGQDGHEIVNIANNTSSRLAITTNYRFDGANAFSTALTETPQQVFEVVFPVVDASQSAGLSFDATLMQGQQSRANGDVFAVVVASDSDNTTLPVELTAFEAVANGASGMVLRWSTASETNNAGFAIEQRIVEGQDALTGAPKLGDWREVGFVTGAGTTLQAQHYVHTITDAEPGTYIYRLRQMDYDGAFEYSEEVKVTVEMAETFLLTEAYPNPFNPSASFSLRVREAQRVRVAVYDMVGRRIAELYDRVLAAQALHVFRLDASQWSSGLYVIHVAGDRFTSSQTVMLVK